MSFLLATALLGLAATLFFLYQTFRYRSWGLRQAETARAQTRAAQAAQAARAEAEDRARAWVHSPPPLPVPSVALEAFVPRLARDEFGPTRASEVRVVGVGDGAVGATTDAEAIVLAVLAMDARLMFEFGTATGRTTYLWARNSPPDARIATLTLAPDQHEVYRAAQGDAEGALDHAMCESAFTRFLYSGTDVEAKVTQLYGDSKTFDEESYVGRCDLIFVDGSHARSYVESDTAKALRMLRPGGVLLWHDYRDPVVQPATIGVYEYLNELRASLPIVRLGSTSLVGYRAPDARRGMTGGAATP